MTPQEDRAVTAQLRRRRTVEGLQLLMGLIVLVAICYGYWNWSRWRDAELKRARTRVRPSFDVGKCKSLCDACRTVPPATPATR